MHSRKQYFSNNPRNKNSAEFKSNDLRGHGIGPPRPIQRWPIRMVHLG